MAEFEAKKAEFEKQQAALLKSAQDRAKKLDGFTLQVTQKAGVDGKLFGSVTNFDIAEELVKTGHEVTKSEIRMPDGPLKIVGDHKVSIALHADVVVEITVSVLGETE